MRSVPPCEMHSFYERNSQIDRARIYCTFERHGSRVLINCRVPFSKTAFQSYDTRLPSGQNVGAQTAASLLVSLCRSTVTRTQTTAIVAPHKEAKMRDCCSSRDALLAGQPFVLESVEQVLTTVICS